ncbi:kinase-like domain-containing protein [Sparassis latifolia]
MKAGPLVLESIAKLRNQPRKLLKLKSPPSLRHINNCSHSLGSHAVTSNKAIPSPSPLVAPHSTLGVDILGAAVREDAPAVLEYPEEPVGLPAALLPPDIPAFMEVHIGDEIGPQGRYTIVRKLGYGSYSSVWLARDREYVRRGASRCVISAFISLAFERSAPSKYVAIKILTKQATRLVEKELMQEPRVLGFMRFRAQFKQGADKCVKLYDEFVCETTRNDTGPHICLVTELLGMGLSRFCKQFPRRALPLPLLKLSMRHLLIGLNFIHYGCSLTHTDLKPDNIMLASPFSDEEITAILRDDPPKYYPTMSILDREVRPIVSQPLPTPPVPMDKLVFKLADFGHAQICEEEVTDDISPRAFRAPEIILQCGWNFKVDMWAVGCLTFELLTGSQLFTPEDNPAEGITADDDHLLRIMQIQGRPFPAEFLADSFNRDQFFNADGTLIHMPTKIDPRTIAERIRDSETVEGPQELAAAAAFIERCLQCVPEDRPDAEVLIKDPWLQG